MPRSKKTTLFNKIVKKVLGAPGAAGRRLVGSPAGRATRWGARRLRRSPAGRAVSFGVRHTPTAYAYRHFKRRYSKRRRR